MSGGSSSVTVGYKYFLGVHMALAHGPLDKITRVEVDRRIAWEGEATGGPIEIDAPELFGGDEREGGISGTVDVEMGGPTQEQNAYLQSQLGDDIPAYRGVAALVLNQCYMANNPYLKPWAVRATRIHVTSDGNEQWYDAKAEIPRLGSGAGSTTLNQVALDYGLDAADTIDVSGGPDWWPFWDGSSTTKFRTYSSFTTTGTPSTQTNSIDSGQGWSRGQMSLWDVGPPVNFLCGDVYAECMQVRDANTNGNYAMLMPSASVSNGPWAGSILFTTFGGGANVGSGQLARSCNTRWRILRPATSDTILIDSESAISIQPDGGGGHTLSITAGFGAGAVTDTAALGTLTGKWYLISFIFESEEPVFNRKTGSTYFWRSVSRVQCRITDEEGLVASLTVEGYGEDSNTVQAIGAELDSSNPSASTQARMFYSGNTQGIAFAHVQAGAFQDATVNYSYLDDAQAAYTSGCVDTIDGCPTMNPAHIIYECLTDSNWGMGYNAGDIDETSFRAAADTLFGEYMGISLMWNREIPLEEFIMEILRHIDGVLYVSRETGKFILKLIRADYSESALVLLDETNIVSLSDARRPTVGELVASVTVNFWDADTGEDASVTHHNQALYQLQQGGGGSTTLQYPGFVTHNLANRVAQRDLKALSTPFLSCRIEVNRVAEELNIGDAFILDWPDLDINGLIMRVQGMSLGNGRNNTIIIDAGEDVYATPDLSEGVQGIPGSGWTDPNDLVPVAALPRIVTEKPYWLAVQELGETAVNTQLTDDPDTGQLLVAGGRQGNETNASLIIDAGGGYGATQGTLDFAGYAYLVADIEETDELIYVTGGTDLEDITVGSIAQIEDELVRVDEIGTDSVGQYVRVGRGVLDTVPKAHYIDSSATLGAGDAIVFWGDDYISDNVLYTATDELNVKLRTVLGSNKLAEADAPEDTVMMQSRAIRPYPPGNLQINGVGYPLSDSNNVYWGDPGLTVSWAHRDRLQQVDTNLYDHKAGDIGPEPGTTYRIDISSVLYDGTESDIWWTIDVGSVNTWTIDSNTDSSRGEPVPDTENVRIRVTAYRDGYASWQSACADIGYLSDSVGFDSVGGTSIGDSNIIPDSIGDSNNGGGTPVIEAIQRTTSGGGASITATAPAGITAGDILFIIVHNDSNQSGPMWDATSDPAGWTFIATVGNSTTDVHCGGFWKVADGTESDVTINALVSPNFSSGQIAWYGRISGVSTLNKSDTGNTLGTSHIVAPAVSTVDGCIIFTAIFGDTASFTTSSGTGWTEEDSVNLANTWGVIGSYQETTAAEAGNFTANRSGNDRAVHISLAFEP